MLHIMSRSNPMNPVGMKPPSSPTYSSICPLVCACVCVTIHSFHDDVIKWKHFPCYWPFVPGPVNSPHKGQWCGAFMFSLICTLNKRSSEQSWGWWFETPSCPLWHHCNATTESESAYHIFTSYQLMFSLLQERKKIHLVVKKIIFGFLLTGRILLFFKPSDDIYDEAICFWQLPQGYLLSQFWCINDVILAR